MGRVHKSKELRTNKKLRTNKIFIILVFIFVVIATIILIVNYMNIKIINNNGRYSIHTNVDANYLHKYIDESTIILVESDKTNIYNLSELGIETNFTIKSEDYINKNIVIDLSKLRAYHNTESLQSSLEKLNLDRIKNQYSELIRGEDYFILTNEVIGNELDTDKLLLYITEQLHKDSSVQNNIVINLDKYYIEFDKNKTRQSKYEKELEKVENTYIEYTNGFRLELKDLYEYLIVENGSIKLDKEKESEYKEYIDNLIEVKLDSYDTVGEEREFKTSTGNSISIKGGTYGNIFSSDLETEYIIELFVEYKNESNRVPIYKREMLNTLDSDYIEVSIEDQHVWVYKNNKLIMDSDIVTGTKGRHDTPLGIYYISEKVNGKYLKGDNYVTWVNKWLRITDRGHGLHDATWRNRFGNNIYTYNGSHGCVNIPKKVAYELFEIAEIGMPVIIY